VVGTSPNLTLTVSNDHVGSYTCRAAVMGIVIEAVANIYLKGPPSITSTKKQFGIPGETVQIECVAFSIPKARHILWSYNGRQINSSLDENYSVLEEATSFGLKSTLVIRYSEAKHFGRYNCSVANDYGHDNVEIELSGQRESQHLSLKASLKLAELELIFPLDSILLSLVIFSDDSQVTYVFIVLAIILFIVMVAMISLICIKSGKKKLPPADVIPEVCFSFSTHTHTISTFPFALLPSRSLEAKRKLY